MISWDTLQQECLRCTRCALCETRQHVVFGDGNPNAEILFIGEGPGQNEDLQGVPFVGAGGHLLDDMLSIIDLDRSKYYITNIVKCRPPNNRDPLQTEQEACIAWLRMQVKQMQPKIIVCLGRIAAMRLIRKDFRISREHGQWEERGGIWFTAFFHPAALLRDDAKKPVTFYDLKSLQKKIQEVCPAVYHTPDVNTHPDALVSL